MTKTLAQKVDWLFDLRRGAHGRPFTYGQVQRATGNRITASYVWKLRTGAMRNPGLSALEALADFFEVPLDYFADGGEYLEESIRIARDASGTTNGRQDALQRLADHASGLSDNGLRAVLEMVEYFRMCEQKHAQGVQLAHGTA